MQNNLLNLADNSDEEILALSQSNAQAFSILVDRYQDAFLRKVKPIIESRGKVLSAEDIVQDTFVKIYLKTKQFKVQEGASFKSWAYKILLNTCFTAYQKVKKEKMMTIDLEPELAELVADSNAFPTEKSFDTDYVLSIVSKLPNTLYRIANSYFLEGKPQKEIAILEGISVGAVRTRIHRARRAIDKIKVEID